MPDRAKARCVGYLHRDLPCHDNGCDGPVKLPAIAAKPFSSHRVTAQDNTYSTTVCTTLPIGRLLLTAGIFRLFASRASYSGKVSNGVFAFIRTTL